MLDVACGDKCKLSHSDILRITPNSDNRLVYYLSGAISTLMMSQFESTDLAALNTTPSFTNKIVFCFSVLLCEMFIHVASVFLIKIAEFYL